jgi:hypothetical protein
MSKVAEEFSGSYCATVICGLLIAVIQCLSTIIHSESRFKLRKGIEKDNISGGIS